MCVKDNKKIKKVKKEIKQLLNDIIIKHSLQNAELIDYGDMISLKFYKNVDGGNKFYKSLEIKEEKDKYKVLILDNNILKVIDLKDLENVIISLDKECQQKKKTQEEIEQIKKNYPKGTRIELIRMNDYLDPVPSGTKGTVRYVDDVGHIEMKWDIKRSLPLIIGLDEFKII